MAELLETREGVQLLHKGIRIGLDPKGCSRCDLAFVSHAHSDHLPKSKCKAITSEETLALARERGANLEPVDLEGVRLIDTGHILGSRGLLVEGTYFTGDLGGRRRAFMGKAKPVKCGRLIVEATYGRKDYRFPSLKKLLHEANSLISELYSKGVPVILMGYPLGKAQVLIDLFSSWGPSYAHLSILKYNRVYRSFGVGLPELESYREAEREGKLRMRPWVLFAPLMSGRSAWVSRMKREYGAVTVGFSGWAVNEGYRYAMGLDYAFPLSDHPDFDELTEFVKKCKPEEVYTVYGYSIEFARHLRRLGFEAKPLVPGQGRLDRW